MALKIPNSDRIYNKTPLPSDFDPNDKTLVNADWIMNIFDRIVNGDYATKSFCIVASVDDLPSDAEQGQTAYVLDAEYMDSFFIYTGTTWTNLLYSLKENKQDKLPSIEDNEGKYLTINSDGLIWKEAIEQVDYYEQAFVIEDSIVNITGDIIIDKDKYLAEFNEDRWGNLFTFNGVNWLVGYPDEGETSVIDLSTCGIDVSGATYSSGSSFEVYSECLNNKSSFIVSSLVTIHCVYLNGILQLKKDYTITDTEIGGFLHPTINFNDYTLKKSDTISII